MNYKTVSLIVVLLIMMVGCVPKAEEVVIQEKVIPVELMQLKYSSIETELVYGGRINPSETVSVSSKLAGKVAQTMFDVGDRVAEGSVLFILDEQDVRNQIRQLQSQLNISEQGIRTAQNALNTVTGGQYESQIMQLESAIDSATKQLESAEVGLTNSELAYDNAQNNYQNVLTNYNNIKILYDAGTVSKSEFDRIELSLKQAETALSQAENGKTQALVAYQQAELGLQKSKDSYNLTKGKITSENVEKARLAVNQASAQRDSVAVQLQIAQSSLNDLTVKSPIAGVVSSRNAKRGEFTSTAMPAFTIVKMDKVNVEVKVSELLINLINIGDVVDVSIKTISDVPIKGKITSISPAADQTSTFPIKIEIDNPQGIIKPGMFAEIVFKKDQKESALVIPTSAVFVDVDMKYVFIEENGTAKKVIITTGIDNGKEVEITSGLKSNNRVVVRGQTYLTDGDKIKDQATVQTASETATQTEGA